MSGSKPSASLETLKLRWPRDETQAEALGTC